MLVVIINPTHPINDTSYVLSSMILSLLKVDELFYLSLA